MKTVGANVERSEVFQLANLIWQAIDVVGRDVELLQVRQTVDLFRDRNQLVVGYDQDLEKQMKLRYYTRLRG